MVLNRLLRRSFLTPRNDVVGLVKGRCFAIYYCGFSERLEKKVT